MGRIRLAFLMCLWGRHEVSSLCLWYMRQVAELVADRCELVGLCVGSEGAESRALAEAYGWEYLEHPNRPVGTKYNAGLEAIRERLDPAAVFVLGSDNVLNPGFIDLYLRQLEAGATYVGFTDAWIVHAPSLMLIHWKGYQNFRQGEPVGSGRLFAASLLHEAGWSLWDPGRNDSLDWSVTQRLARLAGVSTYTFRLGEGGAAHLGLKTPDSLTRFQQFLRRRENYETMAVEEVVLRHFGEDFLSRLQAVSVLVRKRADLTAEDVISQRRGGAFVPAGSKLEEQGVCGLCTRLVPYSRWRAQHDPALPKWVCSECDRKIHSV